MNIVEDDQFLVTVKSTRFLKWFEHRCFEKHSTSDLIIPNNQRTHVLQRSWNSLYFIKY